MKRRDFLTKTTIAAAGLCTLPLMAQTDLSLDIWKDTERALRHELLESGFNHVYHHAGCGHVLFYSDRKFEYGDIVGPDHVILPDGRRPRMKEPYHCHSCDSPFYPNDGEMFHSEIKFMRWQNED